MRALKSSEHRQTANGKVIDTIIMVMIALRSQSISFLFFVRADSFIRMEIIKFIAETHIDV